MHSFYRGEIVKLDVNKLKNLYENYIDDLFDIIKPANKEGFVTIRPHCNLFEVLEEDLQTLTKTHIIVSANNHNPIGVNYSDDEEEEEKEEESEEEEKMED